MSDTLACAIVGHLVGDYLLQNDWMANNKKLKDGATACCVHAWLWTLAVCAFTGWWTWPCVSVLFLTHFFQDRTQVIPWFMRTIGQNRFMKCDDFDLTDMRVIPGLGPWSIIVVDNVWHIVTLWAIWRFIV